LLKAAAAYTAGLKRLSYLFEKLQFFHPFTLSSSSTFVIYPTVLPTLKKLLEVMVV
jgi:hypothetical protein